MQYYMDRNPLMMDTILRKGTVGIPTAWVHVMEHGHLDRIAGVAAGSYRRDPDTVYLAAMKNIGTNMLDQYIPTNPMEMGDRGYETPLNSATTGAAEIRRDGMLIDSPESVVEHLERFVFPRLHDAIANFDEPAVLDIVMKHELTQQELFGESMLKTGYGFAKIPGLDYGTYGYEHYFSAYALYPEVMEQHFSLQADWALLHCTAAAKLYERKLLPPLFRLDHDMADSRGTLVNIASLDRIWFPHFARCIAPLVNTGIRLIWHCDGNLMEMVPRLIDAGVNGFQGFQYEDGMEYKKICAMKTRDGDSLFIWAGVSVTRTLPFGKPRDVKDELAFLVENGPRTGLMLGASSSVAPGVPWENIQTMIEGFAHYRMYGRR